MLSLSIRQIEYAVAVFKYGGVSAAADMLNLSQPALSVAISRIEEHLGKSLFIRRKGTKVIATSFGQIFLEDADKLLKDFNNLLEGGRISEEDISPINIGCFIDIAPIVLAPLIVKLKEKFPKVEIYSHVGDFEWLIKQLKNGKIDFAITYNLGLDNEIDCKEITRLKPYGIVDKNHPFASKESITLRELAQTPLILPDQELSIHHMINLFKLNDIEPVIAHKVNTFEMMRSFVANGLGVGLSYTRPKSHYSYDGALLHHLELSDCNSSEPIVIATYAHNSITQKTNELIDEISQLTSIF